jgi:fermentation-respiration switch protein FrsA (DUF1100 family)
MTIPLVCLALFLLAAALWLGASWYASTRLIHPPRRITNASPADWHLPFENVEFTTRDHLKLRGWFLPAATLARGTIVLCHGYAGDKSPDLKYAPLLTGAGFNLFYFDCRGHNQSEGDTVTLGYLERNDLLAALAFLKTRGINRVGVIGFSMGGSVALQTAPLTDAITCVISDSTFAELWRIVATEARRRGCPPLLDTLLGLSTLALASLRVRANLFAADPLHCIGHIAPRPVFIIHGALDESIPPVQAQMLYARAGEPKELWLMPGASHRAIDERDPVEYDRRVLSFFQRYL